MEDSKYTNRILRECKSLNKLGFDNNSHGIAAYIKERLEKNGLSDV